MSFGKKKSKSSNDVGKINIPAPPRIREFEVSTPVGDTFFTKTEKNKVFSDSRLGQFSKSLLDRSQSNVLGLADELGTTSEERAEQIRQRARDFYALQAGNINSEADYAVDKARSTLSKRTGGSLNSTFGSDYLARLEGNRLSQLAQAGQQAGLLAEDLITADEDSRVRRLAIFDNFINNLNQEATGLAQAGTNVLMSENKRATDVAIARAQLVQQALDRQARSNSRGPSFGDFVRLAGILS